MALKVEENVLKSDGEALKGDEDVFKVQVGRGAKTCGFLLALQEEKVCAWSDVTLSG